MATNAPITGAQTRAPAFDRRKVLCALGIAPAIAFPGLAAATPSVDRAPWNRAMGIYLAALAAERHYDATAYKPMEAELERIAPRPKLWFELTARDGTVARFHVPINDLDRYADHVSPAFRVGGAGIKAAWLAHVEAQQTVRHDEINDELERLEDLVADARNALMLMAAPDRQALWWKLDYLFGEGGGRQPGDDGDVYCGAWTDAWMADARRLLAGSAH